MLIRLFTGVGLKVFLCSNVGGISLKVERRIVSHGSDIPAQAKVLPVEHLICIDFFQVV